MFAKAHRVERAFDMFHLMKADKIEPDLNTYIGLVVGSLEILFFSRLALKRFWLTMLMMMFVVLGSLYKVSLCE
jgi:pentatricopeptide repeat protein